MIPRGGYMVKWRNHHCVGSLSRGVVYAGSFVVVVEAEARRRHGVRKRSSLLQRHSPSRRPPPSPSPSPAQLRFSLLQWRARSTFPSAMRIRKGARCVLPMALVDRSCLRMKGFPQREGAPEQPVPEAGVLPAAAAAAAATSHGCSEGLARENGVSAAETERLEGDRLRKRLSAEGRSRKRPAIGEGVISISSIIQAGVKSAPRRNSTSAPASVELGVTSVTSLAKSPMDCNPSIAEKTKGEPNLLLQSLKKVCSAAELTGLTAKEAVAKILEQGLPGLIEGGERLIVQVAKLFRSSSVFVEREERGRYFVQMSFQELMRWSNFQTGDGGEKVVPDGAETESEEAIDAATQLAKLQSVKSEPTDETVGFTNRVVKSGTGRWVLALRASKRGEEKPSSTKTSPRRDPETGVFQCNREDGRGWRCLRLAESGFSSCKYHREQTRRAESRRRKVRGKLMKRRSPVSASVQPEKPSNPTFEDDVKAVNVCDEDKTVNPDSYESDNKLPDQKRRRFVKAKSLKSL